MGLYPVLYESETETTPDSQSYRLQHISEIQHRLKKEQEIRASLYKKYHRGENACDGFETALAAVGLGLGASGIGLLSTVIAAPVVVGLEAAAGVCGLAAVISKFVGRHLRAKAKKHNEIRVLAESKLNTISDHISKAMQDDSISTEEFSLILSEEKKYDQEKERIRQKKKEVSDKAKNQWIQQGREEAILLLRRNAQRLPDN